MASPQEQPDASSQGADTVSLTVVLRPLLAYPKVEVLAYPDDLVVAVQDLPMKDAVVKATPQDHKYRPRVHSFPSASRTSR